MTNVIKWKDIKPESIIIKPFPFQSRTWRIGEIKYENNNKQKEFIIQTPKMTAPFGLNKYTSSGKITFSLHTSFGDIDPFFLNSIQEIEKTLRKLKKEEEWFGKRRTRFISCIKKDSNGQFAPTFRIKVGRKETVTCFDLNNQIIDIENITKRTMLIMVLKLEVWQRYQGNRLWEWGPLWQALQIRIYPKIDINKCLIIDDNDYNRLPISSGEVKKTGPPPPPPLPPPPKKRKTIQEIINSTDKTKKLKIQRLVGRSKSHQVSLVELLKKRDSLKKIDINPDNRKKKYKREKSFLEKQIEKKFDKVKREPID